MANARDTADACLAVQGKSQKEMAECTTAYKQSLKDNVGKVLSIYEGYMLNYSIKDGSLLQLDKEAKAHLIPATSDIL